MIKVSSCTYPNLIIVLFCPPFHLLCSKYGYQTRVQDLTCLSGSAYHVPIALGVVKWLLQPAWSVESYLLL